MILLKVERITNTKMGRKFQVRTQAEFLNSFRVPSLFAYFPPLQKGYTSFVLLLYKNLFPVFSRYKIFLPVLPLCKILLPVLPLYKRGTKGDFIKNEDARRIPLNPSQLSFFPLSFSPFSKGGLRGISRNLPQPLFYKEGSYILPRYKIFLPVLPLCKILLPVLPLYKRGTKGDFIKNEDARRIPLNPSQLSFFPLSFSPFSKGGLRGISRNLPQPLFYKEGSYILPRYKNFFPVLPLFKRGTQGDFRNLPQPLFYKEGSNIKEVYKEGRNEEIYKEGSKMESGKGTGPEVCAGFQSRVPFYRVWL